MNPQLHQPQQPRLPWITTLLLLSAKTEALSQPSCALQQSRCAASGAISRHNWKRVSLLASRDTFPSKRPITGVHRRSPNNIHSSLRLSVSEDDENNHNNDANPNTEPDNQSSSTKQNSNNDNNSLLNIINPYRAGKSLRSTVESAIDLASAITSSSPASRLSPERRAIYYNYYLDDKLGLSTAELKDSTQRPTTASEWLSSSDTDTRPEVLVVGATGELGRVLVKRLLLENKVRVRVLVRDLYSSTINKLGTGVTYCQGDLGNMESLEYAVTDLDKIVFCAGHESSTRATDLTNGVNVNDLVQRSQEAEKVDSHGLRNLVHAYLNVRHADYGTSQTAKRVLFKFRSASADFDLFDVTESIGVADSANSRYRNTQTSHAQKCSWKENKFSHGIFTGQVTRYGEASVSSVRLRSRNDPNEGLDLQSSGFAGFVCRICSNGGVYEAFLRTEAYERLGVEYVCEFKTASKSPKMHNDDNYNTSRDKFCTVRLDFSDFRPRMRPDAMNKVKQRALLNLSDIPRFVGKDVRQIGFRYRGENNSPIRSSAPTSIASSNWSKFYLALDYIKLYRSQPEPEFVYLSDARIPPVLQDGTVRDDIHKLELSSTVPNIDRDLGNMVGRSAEETYFKYKGEEIIKQSGLR